MPTRLRRPVAVIAACTVLGALLPVVTGTGYPVTLGFQFLVWVVLAVSWNVFSGSAGYPSFGHGVFFGIGIYTTSTLLTRTDLPLPVVVLLSGLVPAALAAAVGAAMFASPRFRGDLFGLVTLALAFIVATVVSNVDVLDGGRGVFVREAAAGTFLANDPVRLYLLALAMAVGTVLVALAIARSRWGTALTAIRDDEGVAESLGVSTYRYKVGTFAVSGGLAGLVGSPQAVYLGYIEVGAVFALSIPLFVVIMAILGGTTTWYGPVLGAALIVGARELLLDLGDPDLAQIVIGLLLVAVIVALPAGIGGLAGRRRVLRDAAQLRPRAVTR
ncbi:branched-chain amino acid ABC transporter permease [Modestobacter versicolor]|uniref:branched-chain amino acid ABC transporter permease n=1 Tax=Modestobacter versicolor TaxID=429133 RepID=UPI0034DE5689